MTSRFGAWAAMAAAVAAVAYDVPQVLQVAGVLTDPWDRILTFAPSLVLAPAFPGGGARRWLRWALIVNGVLGLAIFGQPAWPWLIYVASPWIVVFPAAMVLLARGLAEPDRL
ncbi:MAG: hypothetical protein P4L73_17980 [Caulobacteraceae bacterium]|nr:hypothetical protein [Caulobacteraceae bacterium]